MELILTRHGETLENKQDIMQGHMPGHLSAAGIRQAKRLSQLLAGEQLDAIVCSDLARSRDTAAIIAEPHHLVPVQTALLREIDWGRHTGSRLSGIDWHSLPGGCETLEHLYERARQFIHWLREEYETRKIVVVGHGAINRSIVAVWQGKCAAETADMPIMENTSVIRGYI